MINYILIIIGSVFAFLGIILFIKKIGDKSSSKVKILGVELETGSSALIIFITGAALIAFGATVDSDKKEKNERPFIADKVIVEDSTDNPIKDTPAHVEEERPFKEFALASGQQHVMNDLVITLTLLEQDVVMTADNKQVVKVRVWRNIERPLSDTALLDPSGTGTGVEEQVLVVNAITPLNITDVGAFRFYVYNVVNVGDKVRSVQVKMYRG